MAILLSGCSVSYDSSSLYVSELLPSHFIYYIRRREIRNCDPLPTYCFVCSHTRYYKGGYYHIECQSFLKDVWFSARKSFLAPAFQVGNLFCPLWYPIETLYRSSRPSLYKTEAAWLAEYAFSNVWTATVLLVAFHSTIALVTNGWESIEVLNIDHILFYSRFNTTPLQNTNLRLLYSHLHLNQSNAQILRWLFCRSSSTEPVNFSAQLNLFRDSMSIVLYCYCACLFCWYLK